jgi:molybdopterin biosynthesis enzyme
VPTVTVRGPVRARVLMTGDEISAQPVPEPSQTRDALGPVLADYLRACRFGEAGVEQVADRPDSFDRVFAAATDVDVLVVVGATGGGAADQLRGALTRAQARTLVPRLRMRPGGSTIVAALPDQRIVFGLPGNPFAAVAVLLTLAPALVDGLTGRSPRTRARLARLANAGEVAGPVTRVVPALPLSDGSWIADVAVRTAHLGGLLGREALAIVAPNATDGATVEIVPLP